ncbi:MAG: restriction endonuclease subunit S [Candidatus Brevundimonas colombiensis]|uniref:Restriction endonuclease subunit S n=1 Tax=Candidatus Brevundimonas colombiensis TaxID=3121376 RepID=A0AAJ6BLY1_9CAUL|nr:restriction endonuclease subunit S [Brevundimonas sp.]WEK40519.1 MAG: restriction endonuclease subunit S [Brevundimonas sp.]
MTPSTGALRHFSRIKNGSTPASGEADYWGGDIKWATPEDLGRLSGDKISQTKRQVTEQAVEDTNLSILPVGAVLISTRAPIGHMAITEEPMAFNQGCRGIIPGDRVHGPFLYYLLKSRAPELNAMANGTTFVELSRDELAAVRVTFPPLETQRRIARFLNEKTAQIDGLIEKKRALLDRLAEKRQALITRAVTKGLNPAAPMKPSGIDWLGDIPAHWGLVPFKWRCQVQSGQVDPREAKFADMPLIAPDHIESGTGRLFEVTSAEEQGAISGKYFCPSGSVLYSKIRPALRKVALYDAECLCSADMYAIDPGDHFDRKYLFYFLLTDAFSSYAELESLRVAMPKVNREALGVFPLSVPSVFEQREIAAFCHEVDQEHRRVGDQVVSSINRLGEYRAALINAATTGQLEALL